jgi:hypothetical protein
MISCVHICRFPRGAIGVCCVQVLFCFFSCSVVESGDCPGFSRRFSSRSFVIAKKCAEPHAGDARAYLALLQQTSRRLERERGKHHDSLHLPERPQARQTTSVLKIDDANGLHTFRSVLVDGDAGAKMKAPGVKDPRVATHALFLLFWGE